MDVNKASFTNTVYMQRNIKMNGVKINASLLFCCHVLHNAMQLLCLKQGHEWAVMWTVIIDKTERLEGSCR